VTLVVGIIVTGLVVGGYYSLIVLGLQMTYAGTRVLNFAQGDVAAFGGLLYWQLSSQDHVNGWVCLVLLVPVGFAVGAIFRVVLSPFLRGQRQGELVVGIATIGLSFVVEGLLELKFGPNVEVAQPLVGGAPWVFFGAAIPRQDVVVMAGAAIAVVMLFMLFRYTRVGLVMRANAVNREGALIVGVSVARIGIIVFGIAGAISAVGGGLLVPVTGVDFGSGQDVLLIAFTALVLGGIRSAPATAIGAVVISLIQAGLAATPLEPYGDVVIFGILLLALLIRPEGIAVRRALVRR